LASRREFEEASGSEFDVSTIACNNPAPSIFDEQLNQEKQQLVNDFEKFLNDNELLDFDYSQTSEIQLCPENSAMATISEQDLSQIAEISFPTISPADSSFSSSLNLNQPSTIDNGDKLAQLVAALDPSEALVSCNGWPADPRGASAQPQSASFEKPAPALTPLHGSPDIVETATIYPGETSGNSSGVHSSVTLTLPVATANSFEQPTGQLSGTTWPERVATFYVSRESSYTNSDACYGVHEDTALTNRPIVEEAQQTRPSVIVAARSRKRASGEETTNNDAVLKPTDDDVPPSVLEKRRKGNERCKRYRMNKKQREADEDAELGDLEARNAFLRDEEQRLTARKIELQQAYLDLIRQKKIRFF